MTPTIAKQANVTFKRRRPLKNDRSLSDVGDEK
jgi:hypothetical protein